jgi:hypothetical protein
MPTTRLNVNLGDEPAAALHDLMTRKGISATEAVRRAISVWKFVEDQLAAGRRIAVLDGDAIREVLFQ